MTEHFRVDNQNRRLTSELTSFVLRHVQPPNLDQAFLRWRMHTRMAGSKNNVPAILHGIKVIIEREEDPNTVFLEDHNKNVLAEIYNVSAAAMPGEDDSP